MMNKKELGNLAEELASDYLAKQGLVIIARNYYVKAGEYSQDPARTERRHDPGKQGVC